jgi:glycosyltransferase involved in cell wall biosynthesis
LDTLLPAYLISKLRNKPLVYDTHEIFTEVPEIQGKWVKKVWVFIEDLLFPRVKKVITVNKSIANFYQLKFNRNDISVIRNIPENKVITKTQSRKDLGLPTDRFILIVQGAGINVDRGNEEVLLSLKHLNQVILLIVGSGDAVPKLKEMSTSEHLEDRVIFIPRLPYEQMMQYTMNSDLGISVDKPTSLNYEFSLPNKIFDYIRAGIPTLVSDLVEVAAVVNEFEIGRVIINIEPVEIANAVQKFQNNVEISEQLKDNLKTASDNLNWENDAKVLEEIY